MHKYKDVTDWDSNYNYSEKTQMLLIKNQLTTSLAQHQGGEGRGNLSFYKLFP